ncbi:type II toxin-antitoxin system VapC family toxin [Actinoallomurus sp. NPDC052308]|uniref:type II toxin-antitoxin system VapC family toxin n=1 Tax=Actinoallomurus sp. NPDC052308 TaxID=3155530 RepID=UPI0034274B1C
MLDTHVVLWWLTDAPELADDVKERIDTEPDVFLSAASIWELAIKQATEKIGPADIPEQVAACDLRELPITAHHAMVAGRLPSIHRDPFDRMLVAQAQSEGLTLVTRDAMVQKYDVSLLYV